MPFIKQQTLKVGSTAILYRDVVTMEGTFVKGTKVTITGVSARGYDIEDEYGNRALEIGFTAVYTSNIVDVCNKVVELVRDMSDEELNEDYNKSMRDMLINREIYDVNGHNDSYYISVVRYSDNDITIVDAIVEATDQSKVIFAINFKSKRCVCISDSISGSYYLRNLR